MFVEKSSNAEALFKKITDLVIEKSNGLIVAADNNDEYIITKLAVKWTFESACGNDKSSDEEKNELEQQIISSLADEIVAELTGQTKTAVDPDTTQTFVIKTPTKLFSIEHTGVLIDPTTFEPVLRFLAKIAK